MISGYWAKQGGFMNFEDVAKLSQALAAVATVVGLAFVGIQIRQNTRATRAASHNNVSNSLNEINRMFAESGDLTKIWIAGLEDRKGLSPEDRWRFDSIQRAYMHVCETMFVQAELGSGHDGVHHAEENGIRTMMASPGAREWWEENPYGFCAEFRIYVAGLAPPREPEP